MPTDGFSFSQIHSRLRVNKAPTLVSQKGGVCLLLPEDFVQNHRLRFSNWWLEFSIFNSSGNLHRKSSCVIHTDSPNGMIHLLNDCGVGDVI